MPILHSHLSLSKLQQRSYTSIPVRQCPLGELYTSYSWCQHELSPQASETLCIGPPQAGQTTPRHNYINEGRCTTDEICVGSDNIGEANPIQAYCVSTDHFVRIGQTPSSGNGSSLASSGVVTASFNPALHHNNGRHLAVEVVVTSLSKKTSLFAASVVIQAQAYDSVWRTVAGGNSDCLRCSSLTLAPFPLTAQRVKIDVVLSGDSPVGLLWLASYLY